MTRTDAKPAASQQQTIKPATPLPWKVGAMTKSVGITLWRSDGDGKGWARIARNLTSEDAAFIVAACNSYHALLRDRARLVEELREAATALDMSLNSSDTEGAANLADAWLTSSRALLRELGEL